MLVNQVPDDVLSERRELPYMLDNQLLFVQFRKEWKPFEDAKKYMDGKWNFLIEYVRADAVWDITITGKLNSIHMYTCGKNDELFSWTRDPSTDEEVSVKLDVCICPIKLGLTGIHVDIESSDKPVIHAVHVLYRDHEYRWYEVKHPVIQGYSAISDLWDPSTQTLRAPPVEA